MVGEQSNTLGHLHLNGRKSRHRRIKKQRRYERLAATGQLLLLKGLTQFKRNVQEISKMSYYDQNA